MSDERTARATLTAVAEPGDTFLNRIIDHCGPEGALEAIRAARSRKAYPPLRRRPGGSTPGGSASSPRNPTRTWPSAPGSAAVSSAPETPNGRRPSTISAPAAVRALAPGPRRPALRLPALGRRRRFPRRVPYGLRAAADFASELADAGWTVISGGALGIDAAAHRGSLAADGATVAILANGVDVPYPASNEGLFAEMARRSLLVSESPPGTHPHRLRFLVRNRVIAALSRGTVIVEAEARSGALNTAAGRPSSAASSWRCPARSRPGPRSAATASCARRAPRW